MTSLLQPWIGTFSLGFKCGCWKKPHPPGALKQFRCIVYSSGVSLCHNQSLGWAAFPLEARGDPFLPLSRSLSLKDTCGVI